MPAEYQTPIELEDIKVGDVVLVEYFTKEFRFMGEHRGIARQKLHGHWFFDSMPPIGPDDFRGTENRLFKVKDLDAKPEALSEDRLEEMQRELARDHSSECYDTYDFAVALGEVKGMAFELLEEVQRLRGEK